MSAKGRCTTNSIYLPAGGYTLEKVSLADVTLWAQHPVSSHLVRITTWKDLKDLARAAERARVTWSHSVLVCPADATYTKEEISAHLDDWRAPTDANLRRVYLDEDTARGRQKITLLGSFSTEAPSYPEPGFDQATKERAELIKWLAATDSEAGHRALRSLGAPQIAHLLFGDAVRKDLIAAAGAALLRRGPTGHMGSRHDVVALATAAAPHLSPDRLVDLLAWPVALRTDTWTPEVLLGLGQALAPLSDLDRHKLLEALVIEHGTFARRGRPDHMEHREEDYDDYDYDDDYRYGHNTYISMRDQLRDSVVSALEPYGPEIGTWLKVASDASSIAIPRLVRHRIALAGALTAALTAADIALPTEVRNFDARLTALADAAVPEGFGWGWPKYWSALSGREIKGFGEGAKLCLPNSRRELRSWGQTMGNCIGSYGVSVEEGNVLVAGVRDASGTMVANVSARYATGPAYRGWFLEEIKGRFNADLPHNEYTNLSNVVNDAVEGVHARAQISAVALTNDGIVSRIGQNLREDYSLQDPSDLDADTLASDLIFQDIELNQERPSRGAGRRPAQGRARPAPIRADVAPRSAAQHAAFESLVTAISAEEAVDSGATREALSLVSPLQELTLRDIVGLIACYEPASAYFDNLRAGIVRDALAKANDGDLGALESLTAPGCFVATPATTRAVTSVLRSWFSENVTARTETLVTA